MQNNLIGAFEDKFYYYCYALLRDLAWTVRFNGKWPKDGAERMEFVIKAVAQHFGYIEPKDEP